MESAKNEKEHGLDVTPGLERDDETGLCSGSTGPSRDPATLS